MFALLKDKDTLELKYSEKKSRKDTLSGWLPQRVLMFPMNSAGVMTEELTGTLAEMLLTKQQLG